MWRRGLTPVSDDHTTLYLKRVSLRCIHTHQEALIEALYKCLWRSAMKITKLSSLVHGRRSKFDLMLLIALALAIVSTTPPADARIIRLEILSVQSPTFGGLSFGTVGT